MQTKDRLRFIQKHSDKLIVAIEENKPVEIIDKGTKYIFVTNAKAKKMIFKPKKNKKDTKRIHTEKALATNY